MTAGGGRVEENNSRGSDGSRENLMLDKMDIDIETDGSQVSTQAQRKDQRIISDFRRNAEKRTKS